MSLDGIQKQSETTQQRVADRQEKQEALNRLYRVERPTNRSFVGWLMLVFIVVLVSIGALIYMSYTSDKTDTSYTSDRSDAWYAVHLTDGRVYYGTFLNSDLGTPLVLVNVFYTTPDDGEEGGATTTVPTNKLILVKLGTEAHRPEDKIVIGSEALVYFEKLKNDSPVVDAIEGYLENQ